MPTSKIFGIGFHKTGTTSLAEALRQLGYTVGGPNWVLDPDIADNVVTLAKAESTRFDAFQDNPWPLVFRQMDEMYPNARFILTWREPERWIASQVKHFGSTVTPMREWIYGAGNGHPEGNEAHYVDVYERHNRAVQEHFSGRENKLLLLNFERGDGWPELCEFLGHRIPNREFPRVNTAQHRDAASSPTSRLRRRIRKLLGRPNA